MAAVPRVPGCVPVRGAVAAECSPALLTRAEVHPIGANLYALFALLLLRVPDGRHGGDMRAGVRAHENRLTKSSTLSATSRQPLSMVSACPRPGILTISVTPALRFCFL